MVSGARRLPVGRVFVTARELIEALLAILTICGSVAGSFFGAKISIARLEERMKQAESFIGELRTWKHQVDPYIQRRVDP